MKLTLKAFVKKANLNFIEEFFRKDPRFSLQKTEDGFNIFSVEEGSYTGFYISELNGEIRDVMEEVGPDESGLMFEPLFDMIQNSKDSVNSGEPQELPVLADYILELQKHIKEY